VQQRIAEFKKIKEKFSIDKSKLSEIIEKLEAAVRERQALAQNLSVPDRKALKNEVKALAISIKNVKARLEQKTQELKLVEQALQEAEQHIMSDEKQLAEFEKQEKTKLELMINELNKREQTEQIQQLEEEIKNAEIPEEVKKEVEQSADYMQKQNENFYKAQMNQLFEQNTPDYQPAAQQKDEEPKATVYETAEQVRLKKKSINEDYK